MHLSMINYITQVYLFNQIIQLLMRKLETKTKQQYLIHLVNYYYEFN